MTPTAVLAVAVFAAGFDWLEAVLPILFVAFWVVSQIVNAVQQAGKDRRQPPARPAVKPPRGAERRPDLERQIEEFLGRGQLRPDRRPPPVKARGAKPSRPAAPQPPPLPRGPQPSAAVRGPRAGGTDVADHVHDAFAHELDHIHSSLEKHDAAPETRRPAAAVAAAELTAALRNPLTLRQLILLREVLERPVDRW